MVRQGAFLTGLRNTALIAVPTVVLVIILGSMAAWTIARTTTRWSEFAYYALLGGIFVPPSVITTIFVLRHLHLYGTYLGLIFVYTGLFLSLVVFLFTGFCRTIPQELEEAARIDGANWMTVFGRVVLPLMRPIILRCGYLAAYRCVERLPVPVFPHGRDPNADDVALHLHRVHVGAGRRVS